jgi:hypothetical protein
MQAVAADDHFSVTLGEQAEHPHHLATDVAGDRCLARVDGPLVGHQVGEGRRAVADRLVQ